MRSSLIPDCLNDIFHLWSECEFETIPVATVLDLGTGKEIRNLDGVELVIEPPGNKTGLLIEHLGHLQTLKDDIDPITNKLEELLTGHYPVAGDLEHQLNDAAFVQIQGFGHLPNGFTQALILLVCVIAQSASLVLALPVQEAGADGMKVFILGRRINAGNKVRDQVKAPAIEALEKTKGRVQHHTLEQCQCGRNLQGAIPLGIVIDKGDTLGQDGILFPLGIKLICGVTHHDIANVIKRRMYMQLDISKFGAHASDLGARKHFRDFTAPEVFATEHELVLRQDGLRCDDPV